MNEHYTCYPSALVSALPSLIARYPWVPQLQSVSQRLPDSPESTRLCISHTYFIHGLLLGTTYCPHLPSLLAPPSAVSLVCLLTTAPLLKFHYYCLSWLSPPLSGRWPLLLLCPTVYPSYSILTTKCTYLFIYLTQTLSPLNHTVSSLENKTVLWRGNKKGEIEGWSVECSNTHIKTEKFPFPLLTVYIQPVAKSCQFWISQKALHLCLTLVHAPASLTRLPTWPLTIVNHCAGCALPIGT